MQYQLKSYVLIDPLLSKCSAKSKDTNHYSRYGVNVYGHTKWLAALLKTLPSRVMSGFWSATTPPSARQRRKAVRKWPGRGVAHRGVLYASLDPDLSPIVVKLISLRAAQGDAIAAEIVCPSVSYGRDLGGLWGV